jgi:hypothetical protein
VTADTVVDAERCVKIAEVVVGAMTERERSLTNMVIVTARVYNVSILMPALCAAG